MPNPNPQSRDKDHLIGDKININFDKYLWFKKFYNFIILNYFDKFISILIYKITNFHTFS